MTGTLILLALMTIALQLHSSNAQTKMYSSNYCLSLPTMPSTIVGAIVSSSPNDKGVKTCYFQPKDAQYYLFSRVTKLNLARSGSPPSSAAAAANCPTFKLYSFLKTSSQRRYFYGQPFDFQYPDDSKLLFEANCTNFKKKLNTDVMTSQPNQRLMMEYDPKGSTAPADAYQFTASSYLIGRGYECPSNHFRCWNQKYVCIDETMTCDGYDNCFDNSDEDTFVCTGRIANMPLPLLVIIIIFLFIIVIIIVVVVVFVMRNRRYKKTARRNKFRDLHITPSETYQSSFQ